MKKSTKIKGIVIAGLAVLGIGGTFVAKTEYDKLMAHVEASRAKTQKAAKKKQQEKKMTTKEKQVAYLKEHQQEIVDFVKAQSPKVESVQINWQDIKWSEGGLFESEYYINIYGDINHIEDSSWGVEIPLNDDGTVNMDEMFLGNQVRIGGDPV